jgi:DNA repair protein RadC
MYLAVLEKLLVEDDFLVAILCDSEKTLFQYKEITHEQRLAIDGIIEKSISFFEKAHLDKTEFCCLIHNNELFRSEILEYSREKFAYLFATERINNDKAEGEKIEPIRIIWCQKEPAG